MKKFLLAAALTLGASLGAQAQAADAKAPFRFLIGAGLTYGGATLATVPFTDGSSEKIRGGGLIQIYAGGELRVIDALALQATVGYHVADTSAASNGGVRFTRIPVDMLAVYRATDQFRIGAGAQYVSGPELKGSGVASNVNVRFDNAVGGIVEGEYLITPNAGLKLRYVSERFKPKSGGPSADGSHGGLMFSYYF